MLVISVLFLVCGSFLSAQSAPLPPSVVSAFPGAHGFGANSLGGRGGDVYIVTTLADDGVGSLRHGLDTASGPRTIVFEVAGDIRLQSRLHFSGSHLTLAGQSSPGGVTIRGYPVVIADSSHVIVRFMRFRPGDENAAGIPGKPGRGNADLPGDAADALNVIDSEHVMIDHVSASWSMDETLSVTKSADVTVQNSIISEALNDSFHTEGEHGRGSLIRGTGARGYTFWQNLWAHHQRRMPAIGGQQDPPPDGEEGAGLDIDLVNNVMYDWLQFPHHPLSTPYQLRVNLQGNLYLAGPSLELCACAWLNFEATSEEMAVHRTDNLVDFDVDGTLNPRSMENTDFLGLVTWFDEPFSFNRTAPPHASAQRAFVAVLIGAGASIFRDAVDARIVEQVLGQGGAVINSQDEVGGWPEIAPRLRGADSDRDGMADLWEANNGLDPGDPEDHAAHTLHPHYTNLEIYLDYLSEDKIFPPPGCG